MKSVWELPSSAIIHSIHVLFTVCFLLARMTTSNFKTFKAGYEEKSASVNAIWHNLGVEIGALYETSQLQRMFKRK